MRSYFQCHIEGRRLLLPWLVALVLTVGAAWVYGAVLMPAAPAGPRLDGHFLLGILWTLLLGICLLAAQCVYYYFFVRATLRGTSLYGEAVEADYDPTQYVRLCAKGILLSAVTCGIYLPWLVVSLVRYFASAVIHRLFLCEEPRYRGRGSVLFAYGVLLGVVPMVILPFAASFFLLAGGRAVIGVLLLIVSVWLLAFLRALTLRYLVNFSLAHRRLTTTVNGWQAGWFVFGQLLLAGITLGIYWPMALLRIWRYYVGRTVIGDETVEMRFGFSTSLLTDFGRLFVQLLLTVVTCGIYLPWGYARTMELLIGRTYVEETEPEEAAPMPVDYC